MSLLIVSQVLAARRLVDEIACLFFLSRQWVVLRGVAVRDNWFRFMRNERSHHYNEIDLSELWQRTDVFGENSANVRRPS
jgi:hypothetical protein